MDEEVRISRERISRRRAMMVGGVVSFAGLLNIKQSSAATLPSDVERLLINAPACDLTPTDIVGPYWFDVDSIRQDVREDRPGRRLNLGIRVIDTSRCGPYKIPVAVQNAVVEIWHSDAWGVYSGFEKGSIDSGAGDGKRTPKLTPGGGNRGVVSNGKYSTGETEARTSDDGTYLRGAQVTDAKGIVLFSTIYPGWYPGRSPHVHVRVHINKRTAFTGQVYFAEETTDSVFGKYAPYKSRPARSTTNLTDGFFNHNSDGTPADGSKKLVRTSQVVSGDAVVGVINLGISTASSTKASTVL